MSSSSSSSPSTEAPPLKPTEEPSILMSSSSASSPSAEAPPLKPTDESSVLMSSSSSVSSPSTEAPPLKPTDAAFLNYWLYNSYSPLYASPRDVAFNRNGSVYNWLLRKSYHSSRPGGTYIYRPYSRRHSSYLGQQNK